MPNYRYSSMDSMRRNSNQRPNRSNRGGGCNVGYETMQNGPDRPGRCDAGCDTMPTGSTCAKRSDRIALRDLPVAMAYVPWQHWSDIYEPERALMYGTVFEDLNKPFLGAGGCKNG